MNISNYDRYIPLRPSADAMDIMHHKLTCRESTTLALKQESPFAHPPCAHLEERLAQKEEERGFLRKDLLCKAILDAPLAEVQQKAIVSCRIQKTSKALPRKQQKKRTISSERSILDAPGLSRDFYAHPLSISCENMFSLALEDTLYLYDLERRGLKHQVSFEQLNSIEWLPSGKELAMGAKNGVVQIYNAQKDTSTTLGSNRNLSLINVLTAVGSHKLYIGTENGHTALADLRMKQYASIRKTHTDRVCNIQKQTCGYLMATGGNDRMVKVWDVRSEKKPVHQLPHQAAVKALTFLPWNQRRLMTGGGTDDGHMYLFDMTDGKVVDRMDCGSQICSLIASEEHQEILSTHGFHSPRQPDAQSAMKLVVHSCFPKSREYAGCIYPNTILSPRLQELGMEFEGRQLFAEASPDRRYVVIGTKPESEDHDIITIWDLWDTHKKKDTIVSLFDDLIIR